MLEDAGMMAVEMGISVDEAVKYLSLQENIGRLDAQLMKQEENSFAGLWIEYEPEYRVVVAFTEDGETTILRGEMRLDDPSQICSQVVTIVPFFINLSR